MRPSGAPRLDDRLHGIVHEIEHHLLQLDAVAEDGRQRVVELEFDARPVGGGFGPREHQGIVEHGLDVERAEMRPPAAQELAHAAHDAAGVVDLGDEVRQIGVGARAGRRRASAGSAGRSAPAPGPPSSAG